MIEKILEFFVFRAGLAMGVGIILELISGFWVGMLFGDVAAMAWLVEKETMWAKVISFGSFHIIGWIIVTQQWDSIANEGVPAPVTAFSVEQNGYVYEGYVRRK